MSRPSPRRSSLPCVLLLAASLAGPAAATPAREEPLGEAQAEDERSQERPRVLHLEDGRRLRGRARFQAGPDGQAHWEVKSGNSWRSLPADVVLRWSDLAPLQREARQRREGLPPEDHDGRARLAGWMLEEGLEEEAVAELERVLRADPDHDGALSLIARGPFDLSDFADPTRQPARALRLALAAGESRSAVRRELAVRVLRAIEDREAVREALRRALAAFHHRQRAFATLALRRIAPGEEIRTLLLRAACDPVGEVRQGAALALRASGQEVVILPLVRALSSTDGMLRTRAAESLGNAGFEAAVPALVAAMANVGTQAGSRLRPPAGHIFVGSELAYVADYDVEIAQGAAIADPVPRSLRSGVVLDARAHGFLEYSAVTEVQTIRQSLKQLTGHDAGRNPERWAAWYAKERERYERPRTAGDG